MEDCAMVRAPRASCAAVALNIVIVLEEPTPANPASYSKPPALGRSILASVEEIRPEESL